MSVKIMLGLFALMLCGCASQIAEQQAQVVEQQTRQKFREAVAAGAQDEAKDTIRRYEGTIGKDRTITLILNAGEESEDSGEETWSGSYYYHKTGIPISLNQQPGDRGKLVFREDDHWGGNKDVFLGIWKVQPSGDTISGTWSSPDGKKSLPITLKETYADGSLRMEVHGFKSSWSRKRDRKVIGEEQSVDFLQVNGEAAGVAPVNAALRKLAWIAASDHDEENKPPPPAEISIQDIEEAVTVTQPKELDWTNAYEASYSTTMGVDMNDSEFLCITSLRYSFTGGVHGNHGVSHATFDMTTGKELSLAEITNPGFEKRWAQLGAAEIRSNMGQKPNSPLTESGLFKDTLELNQNWFLIPGGIGFSYNPYEIAPFASGFVEFTLPWKSIAQDLKPGTRVAELANRVLALRRELRQ